MRAPARYVCMLCVSVITVLQVIRFLIDDQPGNLFDSCSFRCVYLSLNKRPAPTVRYSSARFVSARPDSARLGLTRIRSDPFGVRLLASCSPTMPAACRLSLAACCLLSACLPACLPLVAHRPQPCDNPAISAVPQLSWFSSSLPHSIRFDSIQLDSV